MRVFVGQRIEGDGGGDGGFVCWRESIKGDATNLGFNASCHLLLRFHQGRVTPTTANTQRLLQLPCQHSFEAETCVDPLILNYKIHGGLGVPRGFGINFYGVGLLRGASIH